MRGPSDSGRTSKRDLSSKRGAKQLSKFVFTIGCFIVLDGNEPEQRDVWSVGDSIYIGCLLSVCQRQSECTSLKWKTPPFYKSRVIDKRAFLRSRASICDRAFENR